MLKTFVLLLFFIEWFPESQRELRAIYNKGPSQQRPDAPAILLHGMQVIRGPQLTTDKKKIKKLKYNVKKTETGFRVIFPFVVFIIRLLYVCVLCWFGDWQFAKLANIKRNIIITLKKEEEIKKEKLNCTLYITHKNTCKNTHTCWGFYNVDNCLDNTSCCCVPCYIYFNSVSSPGLLFFQTSRLHSDSDCIHRDKKAGKIFAVFLSHFLWWKKACRKSGWVQP